VHKNELIVATQKSLNVFEAQSGRFLRSTTGILWFYGIHSICASQEEVFVSSLNERSIIVYHLSNFRLARVTKMTEYATAVAVSQDGKRLYVNVSFKSVHRYSRWKNQWRDVVYNSGALSSIHKLEVHGNLLFVADSGLEQVEAVDMTTGQQQMTYIAHRPRAFTVYGDEVIICETLDNRLAVLDRHSGQFLRHVGSYRSLSHPNDVVVSNDCELLVCDRNNNRILVYN
jgi:WD40 repeat protein